MTGLAPWRPQPGARATQQSGRAAVAPRRQRRLRCFWNRLPLCPPRRPCRALAPGFAHSVGAGAPRCGRARGRQRPPHPAGREVGGLPGSSNSTAVRWGVSSPLRRAPGHQRVSTPSAGDRAPHAPPLTALFQPPPKSPLRVGAAGSWRPASGRAERTAFRRSSRCRQGHRANSHAVQMAAGCVCMCVRTSVCVCVHVLCMRTLRVCAHVCACMCTCVP